MNKVVQITFCVAIVAVALIAFLQLKNGQATDCLQEPAAKVENIASEEPKTEISISISQAPKTTEAPEPTPDKPLFVPLDIPLSEELQNYIFEKCEDTVIPFELVIAIIECESSYQEDIVSKTKDYGLMQINKVNHRWLSDELGITDFLDPKQNIDAGMFMLAGQFDKHEDVHRILLAYNCGPSRAAELWSSGTRSSAYSRKVVERMTELENLRKES